MPKPYLLKRPSGLYARFLVPVHARAAVGSRFVVRSLGTLRGDAARLAAARLGYALAQQFNDVRGRMSEPGKPPVKVTLRTGTGNELLHYSVEVRPDGTRRMSAEGPEDHALAMEAWDALSSTPSLPATAPLTPTTPATMLAERVELFLAQFAQKQRAAANVLDTTHTLTLFMGIVGDKPLTAIGPEDTDKWLDALAHWPPNASKRAPYKDLSPSEVVALAKRNSEPPISLRTREKHLDRLRVFFNWAMERRDIDRNPCASLHVMTREQEDAQSRRSFTPAELATIFDHRHRAMWCRTPAHWWLPALALYTGARAQELAQLHTHDVENIAGIWGIHIAPRFPGQRLKNTQSRRFVPLHPSLIEAGLLDYLTHVRQELGDGFLFPGLGAKPGDAIGDWFNRTYLRQRLQMTGQVFHCFRHSFITAADRAGVPDHRIARITGHSQGNSVLRGHYIDTPALPERAAAIGQVVFDIPSLTPYEASNFEAFFDTEKRVRRRKVAVEQRRKRNI